MMDPMKSESPSPSTTGEGEEAEGYDLFTPGTREANEPSAATSKKRKRPDAASGSSSSGKRISGVSSKKQASQSGAPPNGKPRKNEKRAKIHTFVISTDFGTTFSGAAYGNSGNARGGVNLFTGWKKGKDHAKIPSVIKFTTQGEIWGIDAKDLPDALKWFKLLLVNESDLDDEIRTSVQLQKARVALAALGKSAVEVVSIFLKHMFEHIVDNLKIANGAETVDTSLFHIVLTVPAIWPEYAKRRMKQAVELSGMLERRPIGQTTHEFISEPHAAALATLSDFDGLLKDGDTIVVVDCGGGTVDIITYMILKTKPTLVLKEVVEGKGALCGAVFLEERFRDLVVRKLTEISEDAMTCVTEQDWKKIMKSWEGIRDDFSGAAKTWDIEKPFRLISRGLLDPNGGWPTFAIKSEEMEEVFSPIVEQINSLIKSQIEAAVKKGNLPKNAILVGGFGSSVYLREYLTHRCQGVEILQCRGWDPWSAICRGAVIHGMTKKKFGGALRVEVRSKIARESVGVVCEEPYDEGRHYPQDKKFDFILWMDVAIRVIKWHVRQGDEVPPNYTISIPFTKYLEERREKIIITIYRSLEEKPSDRKDESVTMATEITWDVRVDWNSLETFENKLGKRFKKLEYNVEMKCSAGATVFSIYHRGRRQVDKNVSLKFYGNAGA